MLKLKNNYILDSDGRSYTLRRKTDKTNKKGNQIILTCGYYSDLETSIQGYLSRLLLDEINNRDMDAKELTTYLKELRDEVRNVRKEVMKGNGI